MATREQQDAVAALRSQLDALTKGISEGRSDDIFDR
jgi:hypothetical protein